MSTRRGVMALVLAWIIVCLAAPAHALPADAVLVGRETRTVTGFDVAREIIDRMHLADIGSCGVTVTLDGKDGARTVALALSDRDASGSDDGQWGGLCAELLLAVAGSTLMRLAAVVVRATR